MRSVASTAWRFALALSVLAAVGCHDVNSVVPDPAEAGEDVAIFGGGFGATQGTSVVRYDGEELAVVSWSDTAIVATLPAVKDDGTYGLEVTVKQDTQAIAHTIGLPAEGMPDINNVVPDPAAPGADISIAGGGFGATQGASRVIYDGEELAIVSWSDTVIVATIPATKASGTYELDVVVGGNAQAIFHETLADPAAGMVRIPEGAFMMGDDYSGSPDEAPAHRVELDAYYMDPTEVTVAAYRDCVDAGACATPGAEPAGYCNWFEDGRDDHPVNCVSWFDAVDYCTWNGKRLPTEAEWEKAATGIENRTYPWGEEPATCDYAVIYDPAFEGAGCGLNATAPVGSKPLGDTPEGLSDMAGNVAEWLSDWYDPDYYAVSPFSNPQGPDGPLDVNPLKVIRGGMFSQVAYEARTANRSFALHGEDVHSPLLGFRCALDG